jgi:hypothetical protein
MKTISFNTTRWGNGIAMIMANKARLKQGENQYMFKGTSKIKTNKGGSAARFVSS